MRWAVLIYVNINKSLFELCFRKKTAEIYKVRAMLVSF